jgi:hypothetical protein
MITLKMLQPFCSPKNSTRAFIQKPFHQGPFTYATDGRIIVRCPIIGKGRENTLGAPDVSRLGWGDSITDFREIPHLPEPEMEACPNCLMEDMMDQRTCDKCGGKRKREKFVRIKIGPQEADVYYLRLIAALPEARIDYSDRQRRGWDDLAIKFKFKGGEGLLMPMGPEKTLMKGCR